MWLADKINLILLKVQEFSENFFSAKLFNEGLKAFPSRFIYFQNVFLE